jgi:hypothetical protein
LWPGAAGTVKAASDVEEVGARLTLGTARGGGSVAQGQLLRRLMRRGVAALRQRHPVPEAARRAQQRVVTASHAHREAENGEQGNKEGKSFLASSRGRCRGYRRARGGGAHGVMLGRWTVAAGRHRRRGWLLNLAQCARERGRWLVA